MKYIITEQDKNLLLQSSVDYRYKLLVINKDEFIVDELTSLQSIGSYNIDAESKVRRTSSFVMYLGNEYEGSSIESKLFSWIGLSFKLQIGIFNLREDDYIWYDCGYYLITEANTSYDATTNSIETSLSDWYVNLNGTRNGQVGGAPTIEIPNVDEDGNIITIQQVVTGIIKDETDIKNCIIDDIGQFYGMPEHNDDYEEYRKTYPEWNQLPYDLKYDVGCNVSDMLEEANDLYPNCQMYFDIYNNFCFNMIPSCEYDICELDDNYIQKILVAQGTENVSYNIESIKNITEVFGRCYDPDRYTEKCTLSTNIYTVTLASDKDGSTVGQYDAYQSGDIIAFKVNSNNIENTKIRINSLSAIPLYYEFTTDYIEKDTMLKDEVYVVQIKFINGEYVAYYLGQYQPHALCVLTNNINDEKYTKSYFAEKYNCSEKNVTLRLEEDSPFAVQKIGEVLDVKSGQEYENILSDSVAVSNSIYYNKQSSSIYDTITITTIMIPFLDVNVKVEYRKQQEQTAQYYIIKSITNNMDDGTSTIVMYRFYPLYFI